MTIHYTEHGALVAVSTNMNVVPRVGDKLKINECICKVKEVIWHLGNDTWVEILI